MFRTYIVDGGDKKCIKRFDEEFVWKADSWKAWKEMGGQRKYLGKMNSVEGWCNGLGSCWMADFLTGGTVSAYSVTITRVTDMKSFLEIIVLGRHSVYFVLSCVFNWINLKLFWVIPNNKGQCGFYPGVKILHRTFFVYMFIGLSCVETPLEWFGSCTELVVSYFSLCKRI
jgi:hypothetical protein